LVIDSDKHGFNSPCFEFAAVLLVDIYLSPKLVRLCKVGLGLMDEIIWGVPGNGS
jgi:hypothetical protein